jgi:pimeloyl-ACP methyl ester carboxylesterase
VHTDELRRLTAPPLLIWGNHDPVGAIEAAQVTAAAIPEAQLEVLPAGHVPYLGHPERASELLSGFVRSESNG